MVKRSARFEQSTETATMTGLNSAVKILAVGDASEWEQQGNYLPTGGIVFASFHELTEALLNELTPTTILSPVLARHFDCIELAILLHNIGYTGAYRAMANNLPKPDLIEREVRQMCPRLNFKLLVAN